MLPFTVAARRVGGCGSPSRTLVLRQLATGRQVVLAFDPAATETHALIDNRMRFGSVALARINASSALDSSSRLLVFTQGMGVGVGHLPIHNGLNMLGPNWVFNHCSTDGCFVSQPLTSDANTAAAEVHYPLDDNAGFFDESLWSDANPWPTHGLEVIPNVLAARNYDRGICDIVIPWNTLATVVEPTILGLVLDAVRQRPGVSLREGANIFGRYGAMLQHTTDASNRDDDLFAVNFTQVVRATANPFTPEIIAGEQLWLEPRITRNAVGLNQLAISYRFSNASDPKLDYEPRFVATQNASLEVALALQAALPAQLATGINDRFTSIVQTDPDPSRGFVIGCDTRWAQAQVNGECGQLPLFTPSAQFGYECVPWRDVPRERQNLAPYRNEFCSQTTADIPRPAQNVGLCRVRIGPSRVNVVPEGLQLVMLNFENASNATNATFIRTRIIQPLIDSGQQDVIASCDSHRLQAARVAAMAGQTPTHVTDLTSALAGLQHQFSCPTPSACTALADQAIAPPPPPFIPSCQ